MFRRVFDIRLNIRPLAGCPLATGLQKPMQQAEYTRYQRAYRHSSFVMGDATFPPLLRFGTPAPVKERAGEVEKKSRL